jgi:hypothetical protein
LAPGQVAERGDQRHPQRNGVVVGRHRARTRGEGPLTGRVDGEVGGDAQHPPVDIARLAQARPVQTQPRQRFGGDVLGGCGLAEDAQRQTLGAREHAVERRFEVLVRARSPHYKGNDFTAPAVDTAPAVIR